MENGTRLAALDLGSNSFRLEIGRYDNGYVHKQEYYKEAIHQGAGLDANNFLNEAAMQRGWDCLARFAERLAGFKHPQVRAVATQTLREAQNREVFLSRAHAILGFPIDVVSGHEEARLIYQGVAHNLPQSDERRLVIDIGGRSTELVLGQGFNAQVMQSYRLGSSAWSQRYFPNGQLTPTAFNDASVAATAVLDEISSIFNASHWEVAYGASGTVGAVADALNAAGLGERISTDITNQHMSDGVISKRGLLWLKDKLLKFQHIDRIKLDGIKDDRRLVIAGGVVILLAIFELLGIEYMVAAQGALRHGALYDLIDRSVLENDVRATSVKRLARHFQTDSAQAERVASVAQTLFAQITPQLHAQHIDSTPLHKKLMWAAQLHEIGSLISHSNYHKHGAYILDCADAPGFALHELHRLSLLVLGHRGKIKKLGETIEDIGLAAQLICLRLAVLLCHARADIVLKGVILEAHGKSHPKFVLAYPMRWEQGLPQTVYLLQQECEAWEKTPYSLLLQAD